MLATRFAHGSKSITSREPLTDEQLRAVAPSIFAADKHESRSARYTYIPTVEVLTGLRKEGFQPFMAAQARSRIEGQGEYTKHMIRLRHASEIAATEANEVVLINSHNGTSSYQMIAGMLRFVCMNGLVVGDCFEDVRVQHKGNIVDDVIEGAYTVLGQFQQIGDHVSEMKALPLAEAEQQAFATAALALRYDEGEHVPVTATQILHPRRREDSGNTVWQVFNRVEENMVRGGITGVTQTGRRSRTREVRGIDGNVKLNRALWLLAEEMRKLKAA